MGINQDIEEQILEIPTMVQGWRWDGKLNKMISFPHQRYQHPQAPRTCPLALLMDAANLLPLLCAKNQEVVSQVFIFWGLSQPCGWKQEHHHLSTVPASMLRLPLQLLKHASTFTSQGNRGNETSLASGSGGGGKVVFCFMGR